MEKQKTMKNKLIDIHNNLMATLEDLDNPELLEKPEELEKIVKIANAKSAIANTLVRVDSLGLQALAQRERNEIELADTLRLE